MWLQSEIVSVQPLVEFTGSVVRFPPLLLSSCYNSHVFFQKLFVRSTCDKFDNKMLDRAVKASKSEDYYKNASHTSDKITNITRRSNIPIIKLNKL